MDAFTRISVQQLGKKCLNFLVTGKVVQYHLATWRCLSQCVAVGDTRDVGWYPHDACRLSVLYLCVSFPCALGSTGFAAEWYKMYCGLIRWLLAYGQFVISLTSVPYTIG